MRDQATIRRAVDKTKSAKQFSHNVAHTKALNVIPNAFRQGPMRGGIRL